MTHPYQSDQTLNPPVAARQLFQLSLALEVLQSDLFENLSTDMATGHESLAALAVLIADDLLDHAGEKSKDTSTAYQSSRMPS